MRCIVDGCPFETINNNSNYCRIHRRLALGPGHEHGITIAGEKSIISSRRFYLNRMPRKTLIKPEEN